MSEMLKIKYKRVIIYFFCYSDCFITVQDGYKARICIISYGNSNSVSFFYLEWKSKDMLE